MLKSIEISGFKSFGKKAKLDFKTPISAIVGPNGSGKSNVAEAFRFALGEQSMKSLRGKKSEDLIFNGSGTGHHSNRASVKIVFDNSKRVLDIDFDEVIIERVVNRDSSQEYKINNSKVRRKDIVELLAKANIGSTGHHIISQGEADRILIVSPQDRREMIEDALGLKIYHYKKKESLRKLTRTEQNLKEVESLRREIKPHIKFLKKQVEKVEKAKVLRDEIISLYKEYFVYEDEYIKIEKKEIQDALLVPTKESKELESEVNRLRNVIGSGRSENEYLDKLQSIGEELSLIQKNRNKLTRDMGHVEGELDAEKRIIGAVSDTDDVVKVPISKIKIFFDELKSSLENISDITSIKNSLNSIYSRMSNFIDEYKKDDIDIDKKRDNITLLSEKHKVLENEIRLIDEKKDRLLEEQSHLQKKSEKEKESFLVAERDLFKVLAEQNKVRTIIEKLESRNHTIKQREVLFMHELADAGMSFGRSSISYDDYSVVGDEDTQKERAKKIERLKVKLEDSGFGSYGELKKEYNEVAERDIFLEKEITDLRETKESLMKMVKDIDDTLNTKFKDGIEKINKQFNEFFSVMFGGGSASLVLVKPKIKKDELEMDANNRQFSDNKDDEENKSGIDINVNLPKKKIKGLQMLSGGERALTSIALLFALSQINPPPFIILDETDAALDEANSKRYGDMVSDLSKYSQLILITHNRETMLRAGVLYGVTMKADGISRLLSIEFSEAVQVAK